MRHGMDRAIVGDLPRRALRSLVNEGQNETIGGAVQYGCATRRGFEPLADGVPINPPLSSGRNLASLVLGFDVLALRAVGDYFISKLVAFSSLISGQFGSQQSEYDFARAGGRLGKP
jgi:hypothetical protein